MNPPTSEVIVARQRRLLAWYEAHGRRLPWRDQPSLYGTWISEVMLQQTTVATVIPRWTSFLQRFPDVTTLAAADEGDVLAAWTGLGYYRRARLLHRAAREVVEELDGRLPTTVEGWRRLPGIGEYAAGAVASIGLGLPTAAVDANVTRVLTRWTCANGAAATGLTAADVRRLAAAHVPDQQAGDWNQALMDLGAGRCRSGMPTCDGCPVRDHCAAGQAGTGSEVPAPVTREAPTPVVVGALVLHLGGKVLLLPSEHSVVARPRGLGRPRRTDLAGLFTNMLGFPTTPWYDANGADAQAFVATWRRWLQRPGNGQGAPIARGWIRHAITTYRLQVLVCEAEADANSPVADLPGAVWTPLPATGLPISTLARKVMQRASLA